jgi:LmbE family N-acetylglucosaminyl deacetylase
MRLSRLAAESELIPYTAGFPPGRRWLVLAPHPDDETLCVGATLALAAARGVDVRLAIVTDGGRQGDVEVREAEAAAAARELGVAPPEHWRLGDRTLASSGPRLLAAVVAAFARHEPDNVLVTSPVELHPDHRALALATQRAVRRSSLLGLRRRPPQWVTASEVATPLHPNLLVAGDAAWERKRRAIAAYASQLQHNAYDAVSEAMGVIRRLTLSGCEHAEALHVLPAAAVARRSAGSWAAAMGSPLGVTRSRGGR